LQPATIPRDPRSVTDSPKSGQSEAAAEVGKLSRQAVPETASASPRTALQYNTGHALIRFVRGCPGTRISNLQHSGIVGVAVEHAGDETDAQGRMEAADAVMAISRPCLEGGDRVSLEAHSARGTRGIVRTANGIEVAPGEAAARVTVAARLGDDAVLTWLPHPTVLHPGGRLNRTMSFDLAAGATLFALESFCLPVPGADGIPDAPACSSLTERWRIWRNDRLLWASEQSLTDDGGSLSLPSTLAGFRAAATLVYAGNDCGSRLPRMRMLLQGLRGHGGATGLPGIMLVKLVARNLASLQHDLGHIVEHFPDRPVAFGSGNGNGEARRP
jgi:urease accessory protein UreH